MIEFIKESSKMKELYIDAVTLNKIIENFKKEILDNKDTFLELANLDKQMCNQIINLNAILNLLEELKNESIVIRKEKEITLASYYGSPYITINLCMQSLIQRRIILVAVEDNMLAINKFLISIFNNILEEYKICKMINLYNLVKIEKIQEIEEYVNNIICIGNTNTYYKYKKKGIKNIEYIPFKNMAIFCEDDKFLEIQYELYKFASSIGIETEIYEDIEEFIECVNLDDKLENIVVFTKKQEIIELVESEIKNCKLYINKNPFKGEKFKLSMEIA